MTTTSTSRWRSFTLHKDGNQPDEYEDAFAGDPKVGRFAVADGASESSFASQWAKLLVEGFIAARGRTTLNWLLPLQQKWAESVDHLDLDWFGEEKRVQGAFATFLGLVLQKAGAGQGRWRAVAVGDCCLFQVRQESVLAAFPVQRAADFGNRPPLLCSRAVGGRDGFGQARRAVGKWQTGDRFFLLTDALAEWFLQRHEQQRQPWDSLRRRLAEPTAAALIAYIEQLRSQKELKNDDVTILTIDL